MQKGTEDFIKMKLNGEKIVMITAYDYVQAGIAEEAGVDIVLVGDSLATTVQGKDNTISVTLDEMIYHTKIVRAGLKNTFLACDMPFMSYQVNSEQALINAGRILKESGANAVKMEGGANITVTVKKLTESGIPVIGHIGLMPQFINVLGGYKVQGKISSQIDKLVEDAKALEDAGAFHDSVGGNAGRRRHKRKKKHKYSCYRNRSRKIYRRTGACILRCGRNVSSKTS
jgi:ketopantoate hydroxymethyltransferase (EC 2.1.2.11)